MENSSDMIRKERDSFLDGLRRFHSGRGTHVRQLPTFGGREVDLFQLYKQVTVRGGWGKVNEDQKWDEIAKDFHLPDACANVSQALRYIYIRYLDIYEKVHYFGEDPDARRPEGQEELPGQRKKVTYAATVPMMYNYSQHRLSDYMRRMLNLPKPTESTVYDKLQQSLVSGLPNEVDFTMNICTLLSSEGKHTLNLQRAPQLVNLMLGHIGVFCNGPGSLKQVHMEAWKPASGHNFLRFWWESITDAKIRKLICEDVPSEFREDEGSSSMFEFLNIGRDLGMYDKEGQRVIQVAMVLRNISFEVENMKVLASNELFLKYIMLAAHCNYHSVRQLALDTLGNIGLQMVLNPLSPNLKCAIFTILRQCLLSNDKFEVVTGLELLARLCQVPSNNETLGDALDSEIYTRIVSYLTVHDIQLIAYTLECLYQLSELGEVTSTQIASVSKAVATLVSLVTVEAQSYGPESIKGIRVVEHIPAGMASSLPAQHPPTPQTVQQRPGMPQMPTKNPPTPQQIRRPVAVPTPPTRAPPACAPTPPPRTMTPPPALDPGQSLTCRWLHSFYELDPSSQVNKMEVYAHYLQALSKIGHTRVPDLREMLTCVRVVFPKVDLVKIEKDNGSNPIYLLKGLKPRNVALPFDGATTPGAGCFVQPPPRVSTPQHQTSIAAIPKRPSTPQNNFPLLPRSSSTPVLAAASSGASTSQQSLPQPQRLNFQNIAPKPSVHQEIPTTIPVSVGLQPTPPHSPPNKHSMLQQALTRPVDHSNTLVNNVNTPPSPSPTPPPVHAQKQADQTLIKTLLANKLQQNIQKMQETSVPNSASSPNICQNDNHPQSSVHKEHTTLCHQGIPETVLSQSTDSQNKNFAADSNKCVTNSSKDIPITQRNGSLMPPPVSSANSDNTTSPCIGLQQNSSAQNSISSKSSSAFESEFQQFMQTNQSQSESNTEHVKKTRKKSSISPPKGRVKRSKSSSDGRVESAIDDNSDNAVDNVISTKSQFNDESIASNIVCEQKDKASDSAVEPMDTTVSNSKIAHTTDTSTNGNAGSDSLKDSVESKKLTLDLSSSTTPSKLNQENVFNGACVPSQSPTKEISPNKFNASIEEKKARIAQLMKDTKMLKEQLKGINGVSVPNAAGDNSLSAVENNVNAMESNSMQSLAESQGLKTNSVNEEKLIDAIATNPHCQVNGFPEAVNGDHGSSLKTIEKELTTHDKDLNSIKDSSRPDSTSNESLGASKGLSLDDLNRNNNCNGDGDSPPPSPLSTASSLPEAGNANAAAISNPNPPFSVQPITTPSGEAITSQSIDNSNTQSQITQQQSVQNQVASSNQTAENVFVAPAAPNVNGQFVQPIPGGISTPKVIMSAVQQGQVLVSQPSQSPSQFSSVQEASQISVAPVHLNVQVPVQLTPNQTHQMAQQISNQLVQQPQPQVIVSGNQVVTQQGPIQQASQIPAQVQVQTGQIPPQPVPAPLQQVVQATQLPTQNQSLNLQQQNLIVSTAQGSVQMQVSQGQFVPASSQGLVQQIQGQLVKQNVPVFQQNQSHISAPQNVVINQQGVVTAPTSGVAQGQVVPQGVTQSQIITPQGQVIQQALPSQLVQQLIQQAQLAQQQQAPTGAVLVQQAQNQVIPQVVQGQVVMQGQNIPQATMTVSQNVPSQIQLQVGQVLQQQVLVPQQQVVQNQSLVAQAIPQQSILPQPVVTAQIAPPANAPVRFLVQPSSNSAQTPIQVSTNPQPLTTQNVALINQASNMSSKPGSQYPTMQQQLHSSYPSITTPPPASPQSSRSSPGPLPSPGGTKSTKRPPSRQSDAGDKPKKKRRSRSKESQQKKGSSVPSSPSPVLAPPIQMAPMTSYQYMCEWASCMTCFESHKQLQKHVIQTHFVSLDGRCYWQGCDTLRRAHFSLVTHVQDKHLNEAVLRAAALRRHQQGQSVAAAATTPSTAASTTNATSSSSSAPPPVYPENAAVQAIKRFAVKPPYQELMEMKEGPVTKHIRLTSALILRNLARYSAKGRREIKKYEEQLAYVALSPVESSAAISSCLAELYCC